MQHLDTVAVVCNSRAGRHGRLGPSTVDKFTLGVEGNWLVQARGSRAVRNRKADPRPRRPAWDEMTFEDKLAWASSAVSADARTAPRAVVYPTHERSRTPIHRQAASQIVRPVFEFRCPLCHEHTTITDDRLWRILDAARVAGMASISLDTLARMRI